MTGDPGSTVQPDPFGGAPGVEPYVWTTDDGPDEPEAYEPEPKQDEPVEAGQYEWSTVADPATAPPAGPLPAVRSPVLAPRQRRTPGFATALAITLVVSGPILLIELNWRGAGITDQPHYLWALAFAAVALSFVAGGLIVGLRAETAADAFGQGLGLALLSSLVLILAAAVRQLIVDSHFPRSSTYLWFVIEIGVVIWCACAGALLGRLLSLRSTAG